MYTGQFYKWVGDVKIEILSLFIGVYRLCRERLLTGHKIWMGNEECVKKTVTNSRQALPSTFSPLPE